MSSRHSALDGISCCSPPKQTSIQWEDFHSMTPAGKAASPIDEFYEAQRSLVLLAQLVGSPGLAAQASKQLAGQVLLGYVSATEFYLRRTVARMVRVCPYIRAANSNHPIPFGAIDYYGASNVEQALTDQISFVEAGKLKSQLSSRLMVNVRSGTSLERSINDFDRLCQLRHALVHSHGVLSPANASLLLGKSGARSGRAMLDSAGLDRTAGITSNLVRDVNIEVVRSTLWGWVQRGHATPDRRTTRPRVQKLLDSIGSETDKAQGHVSYDTASVTDAVISAAVDFASRS